MRALAITAALLLVTMTSAAQRTTKKPAPRPQAKAAEAQRHATEAEDREAIEQLHQDDIAGSLAFDVDKLTSTWDDEIVSLPPNAKPIAGKAANVKFLESQQKAMANVEILGYEETWDEVRILGEYAYEYGSLRSRIRQQNAKDETPLEFNVMRVLRKQPSGAWKVYRTIWNDRNTSAGEKEKRTEKP
jgi:ketosteroid isomerase-like protein